MTGPRILTIFGTRPEAIKLFPVVAALRARGGMDVRTCVTAQHRGLLDQVLAIAGLVPDIDLDLMEPGQTLDRLTARLLTGLGEVMDAEKPDRVIVQGDTATAMVGALAAYYRKIPVSHVEAGLRSGNIYQPWPEEINRRIVAPIADQHFAPTQTAADALLRENIDPAQIHVTGNTVIDALHWTRAKIAADPSLASGLDEVAKRFAGKRLILVTTHRRENFGEGMEGIARALARIADRGDTAILFPMHPNPNVAVAMDATLGNATTSPASNPSITPTSSARSRCARSRLPIRAACRRKPPRWANPSSSCAKPPNGPRGSRRAPPGSSAPTRTLSFRRFRRCWTTKPPIRRWPARTIPSATATPPDGSRRSSAHQPKRGSPAKAGVQLQ